MVSRARRREREEEKVTRPLGSTGRPMVAHRCPYCGKVFGYFETRMCFLEAKRLGYRTKCPRCRGESSI